MKKRWIEREVISAVHDNDLQEYLSSIGILRKLELNEYHCAFCEAIVNLENIGAVFSKDGEIYVTCEQPKCTSMIGFMVEND